MENSLAISKIDEIVRPNLSDTEIKYVAIILFSGLLHVGLGWWLTSIDIQKIQPKTIDQLPERLVKIIMNKRQEKEKVKQTTTVKKAEEKTTEAKRAEKKIKEKKITRKKAQASVAKRAKRVQNELRNKGLLALLTGVGPSRSRKRGAIDVLAGQQINTGDLDEALSKIKGLGRAVRKKDLEVKLTKKKEVEKPKQASIRDLVAGFGKKKNRRLIRVGSRISIEKPKTVGSATKSAMRGDKVITRRVKARMASIKAVYNRALKQNPSLAGKLTIRFTILPSGRVTDVTAIQSTFTDTKFVSDILRRIKNLRFPAINESEGNVTVNFPFVFQPEQG